MPFSQAKHEVEKMLKSGYQHFSREYERTLMKTYLLGTVAPDFSQFPPGTFFLADQPLRSAKNMGICLVVMMREFAQDNGADDRKCYAFSDVYIDIIEEKNDMREIITLFDEILFDYRNLIQQGRKTGYSRPIQRAIRLIGSYVLEPCSLARIAEELQLHPSYLSNLFKKEVGINITQYIRERKIEEAKDLLLNTDHSISEIAEMLGYNSVSYFSKVFRKTTKISPREYVQTGEV